MIRASAFVLIFGRGNFVRCEDNEDEQVEKEDDEGSRTELRGTLVRVWVFLGLGSSRWYVVGPFGHYSTHSLNIKTIEEVCFTVKGLSRSARAKSAISHGCILCRPSCQIQRIRDIDRSTNSEACFYLYEANQSSQCSRVVSRSGCHATYSKKS